MKPTMEHRKRRGRPRSTCLWAVFLAAAIPLHAGGSGAFTLDLRRDLAISLPGAGVVACGQLIARNANESSPVPSWGSTGRAADEAGTPSSGYGLYLALRAADKLGVRVSLSDAEGAGTVAAVSIPVERARFA